MHVAIHNFSHDDEEFVRGKTFVHDDHPAVAAHPGCFAPAPENIGKRSERRARHGMSGSTTGAPRPDDQDRLEEELAYRRDTIARHRVLAREEERARERERREAARENEERFWTQTAELLSGPDANLRAQLDELNAIEQEEADAEAWSIWRRSLMDPSRQEFWDEAVELGERLAIDPDGSLAESVRAENARIRRRKKIESGEAELFGGNV